MAGEAGCFIVVLAASDHKAQRDQKADDVHLVSIWSHLATSSHLSFLLLSDQRQSERLLSRTGNRNSNDVEQRSRGICD
jgi:hypothetical protein